MQKMLTPAEAAELLKLHISTIRRLYRDGELEYCRLGHRTIRIYQSSVLKYLEDTKASIPKAIPEYSGVKTDFKKLPPAGIY